MTTDSDILLNKRLAVVLLPQLLQLESVFLGLSSLQAVFVLCQLVDFLLNLLNQIFAEDFVIVCIRSVLSLLIQLFFLDEKRADSKSAA